MWKQGYMSSINADLLSPSRKVREGLSWETFLKGERWTDLIDWTAFLHHWRKSDHNSSSPTQEEPLYRKRLLEDHAPCKNSYWTTLAQMLWWPGKEAMKYEIESNNMLLYSFSACLWSFKGTGGNSRVHPPSPHWQPSCHTHPYHPQCLQWCSTGSGLPPTEEVVRAC